SLSLSPPKRVTDFLPECRPRAGSRIHPRKAHAHGPSSSSSLPTPAAQEEGRGVSPPPAAALLRARPLSLLETVRSVPGGAASGSPPLGGPAPQPDPLPLLHPEGCPCPVCGDPSLTGSCLRWALLRARAGGAPSLETVRRRCRERAEAFSHSLLGLALQALGRPCPELLPSSPGLYSYLEARAYSQEARAYSQEARAWFSSKPAGPWQLEQARASLLLALVSQERGLSRLLPPAAPASPPPPPPPPPQSRRKAPRPTASSTTTSTGGRPRAPARSGPRTRLRKRFDDSDLEPEGEEEQGGAGRKGRGRRGTQARTRPRGEAEESKGEDRLETGGS
ncbi:hypothetical protein chiPu_0028626, partial [Chiloscyllium punctatum]|nr:hypothetical protein [Chiloscyllium punctatum]